MIVSYVPDAFAVNLLQTCIRLGMMMLSILLVLSLLGLRYPGTLTHLWRLSQHFLQTCRPWPAIVAELPFQRA